MIYQNNKSKVWYMDFVVNGSRVHKSSRTVNKKDTGMRRGELLGTTLRDLILYPQEDARIMSYENKESAVKAISP